MRTYNLNENKVKFEIKNKFNDQILKERAGDQLLGESSIRGETLRLLFESRIEQNQILANDPMIRLLTAEMNKIPIEQLKDIKEEKLYGIDDKEIATISKKEERKRLPGYGGLYFLGIAAVLALLNLLSQGEAVRHLFFYTAELFFYCHRLHGDYMPRLYYKSIRGCCIAYIFS